MRIFNSTQNALSKQSPRAKKMISGSFHSKCQKIPPSNAQITAYMSVYIADFTYVCVYICMVSCESYDPFTHLSSRTPPPHPCYTYPGLCTQWQQNNRAMYSWYVCLLSYWLFSFMMGFFKHPQHTLSRKGPPTEKNFSRSFHSKSRKRTSSITENTFIFFNNANVFEIIVHCDATTMDALYVTLSHRA